MKDKKLERKNQLFSMNFVFGALKNYDGFKKAIEEIVDKPKNGQPRPLLLMKEIVKLAENNPEHVEFVCRASRTGTFKRFGEYLEKLDGPKDYGPEKRIEFPPRETEWESLSAEEKIKANHVYGMQVSFGHLPNADKFVKDVEKIFDENKSDRALRLLKAIAKFGENNPEYSGPILRAQKSNSYKDLSKRFLRMDMKDAEAKQAVTKAAVLKKQQER